MEKQYGKEKGKEVFYSWVNKHGYDDTKPLTSQRKKEEEGNGFAPKEIWKVYVSVFGENCDAHGWHTNAIEYPSKELADEAGSDLASRWTMVKEWESRKEQPKEEEASTVYPVCPKCGAVNSLDVREVPLHELKEVPNEYLLGPNGGVTIWNCESCMYQSTTLKDFLPQYKGEQTSQDQSIQEYFRQEGEKYANAYALHHILQDTGWDDVLKVDYDPIARVYILKDTRSGTESIHAFSTYEAINNYIMNEVLEVESKDASEEEISKSREIIETKAPYGDFYFLTYDGHFSHSITCSECGKRLGARDYDTLKELIHQHYVENHPEKASKEEEIDEEVKAAIEHNIGAEQVAQSDYEQLLDMLTDEEMKEVVDHIYDEEVEHEVELKSLLGDEKTEQG